jgi:hypothetical protein
MGLVSLVFLMVPIGPVNALDCYNVSGNFHNGGAIADLFYRGILEPQCL